MATTPTTPVTTREFDKQTEQLEKQFAALLKLIDAGAEDTAVLEKLLAKMETTVADLYTRMLDVEYIVSGKTESGLVTKHELLKKSVDDNAKKIEDLHKKLKSAEVFTSASSSKKEQYKVYAAMGTAAVSAIYNIIMGIVNN